jgi:DNA-binding MarR family transcriptional regulator
MSTELLQKFGELRRGLQLTAKRAFAAFGLGPKQVVFVRYLAGRGPLAQGELARLTGTDPGATARALDTLTKRGWVERLPSPHDRRRLTVRLTAEGRSHLAAIDAAYAELAARIFAPLSAEERAVFLTLVEKLVAGLAEEPTAPEEDE